MESNRPTQHQLERERAAYHYLEALDTGDIDAIIAVLEKAADDATLEQMVLDAHQAYFQVTPGEHSASAGGQDTELDRPMLARLSRISGDLCHHSGVPGGARAWQPSCLSECWWVDLWLYSTGAAPIQVRQSKL